MRIFHSYHNKSPWMLIIGVIVILSAIFTIMSKKDQQNLNAYTKSDKVSQEDTDEDKEDDLDIDMSVYTDNKVGFSISVPSDWNQVTKDGYPTFIHSASASSLQIQTLDYDPSINNTSEDTVSTQIAEDGKTFLSFQKTTDTSYEIQYQSHGNSTYDYVERVYWDRSKIVKLLCIFNDANYDKISPYYDKILKSFAWNKSDPVTEGYYLYYNDSANFEIGIPDDWALGTSGNALVASDSSTGASMTLSATDYTGTLSSVTGTDVVNLVRGKKSNFIMNSYDNSEKEAKVTATYVQDNVQMTNIIYLFCDGTRLYIVSFDYEQGTIKDDVPAACAKLFRSFNSSSTTDDSAKQDFSSSNQEDTAQEQPSNSETGNN